MAEMSVKLRFGNGTAVMVFSEKTDHMEMPIDKAIEVFDECHKRCIAEKLRQAGRQEQVYPPGHPSARSPWADEIEAQERKKK